MLLAASVAAKGGAKGPAEEGGAKGPAEEGGAKGTAEGGEEVLGPCKAEVKAATNNKVKTEGGEEVLGQGKAANPSKAKGCCQGDGGEAMECEADAAPSPGSTSPGSTASSSAGSPGRGSGSAKPTVPRIFFATRTHSQIAQVVKELKRSEYKPRMAILAAKQHYCINKAVIKTGRIDEACEELMQG
ncbi:helicase ATP-binding domain-containing protein, partial [Haematococcus lacustris]